MFIALNFDQWTDQVLALQHHHHGNDTCILIIIAFLFELFVKLFEF